MGLEAFLTRAGMMSCLQAGAIRRRECFAGRYGLRLVFYTEGSLDSIKNFAVIPCGLIYKRIYDAETSQMRLRPQPGGRAVSPDTSFNIELVL